jgi:hypothetical protein
MTAIAYRDGVMAADSMMTSDALVYGFTRKVVRSPDGGLAAPSGTAVTCHRFRQWFEAGNFSTDADFEPTTDDPFYALIVGPSGEVFRFDNKYCYPIRAPFHVLGCGERIMIGAMAAGATAEEAVRIAITYDRNCGGEVQVEGLDGKICR